ncbi:MULTISPECIES: DUF4145 domain-containing protein [unclassified Pseudomonas]|uniref:DUF4145 domain-containing protein n=1 Tax=unclassified Pseudomonas TaxID=196821 RepID=UPI001A9E0F22|nr:MULTISPECIES: DUF4145 domain-containing protein [unclassified Pseudomonas]
MEREIFENVSFCEDQVPKYPCPSCGRGQLKLKGELQSEFTAQTELYKDEEWFDWEDHADFVFSGMLRCTGCDEAVFLVGSGKPKSYEYEDETGRPCRDLFSYHTVRYFQPFLKLIDCPDQVSDEFRKQIDSAFSLYFTSPSACCNSIRCAVEVLLTDWGIPLRGEGEKYIPLGNRLSLLPENYSKYLDFLKAVKWLGNSGSHADQMFSHSDALDGLEMLEYVLSKVYDQHGPRITAMADRINEHKGPVRR